MSVLYTLHWSLPLSVQSLLLLPSLNPQTFISIQKKLDNADLHNRIDAVPTYCSIYSVM